MGKLEVREINVEKLEVCFLNLNRFVEMIAEQRKKAEENQKEINEILATIEESMLKFGATPEEIEEAKHITPEKEAEKYPKEYLEFVTKECMHLVNNVSNGVMMTFLGSSVNLGIVIEKCKQTQMDFSEIPQDDYKKRYIVSKKAVDYILYSFGMFSDKDAEEKGTTGPVKKIGTK